MRETRGDSDMRGQSHQQPVSMPCDPKPFSMCKDLIAALRIPVLCWAAGRIGSSAHDRLSEMFLDHGAAPCR